MSKQGFIVVSVLILAVIFAPVLLGDAIAQFFRGLGIVLGRWIH